MIDANTDRQTDRQTGRQADRQTDRQRQRDREKEIDQLFVNYANDATFQSAQLKELCAMILMENIVARRIPPNKPGKETGSWLFKGVAQNV